MLGIVPLGADTPETGTIQAEFADTVTELTQPVELRLKETCGGEAEKRQKRRRQEEEKWVWR